MSKQSLRAAIAAMEVRLAERLVDYTSRKIHEVSKEIKEEIETEYNYFFQMIVDEVIGSLSTPGILSPYTTWAPLSKRWTEAKGTKEHYVGLSNSKTTGKALRRRNTTGISRLRANGPAPRGKQKIGSFQSYIQSLNSAGTTARFFGPASITYDFKAPNVNLVVASKQSDSVVAKTLVKSLKRGVFVKFPKTLNMAVHISAFGKLKGVKFDERSVVDYIIKRIDPQNEKQWVKINSTYAFGRNNRPIRAVVTPILRYYMDKRFSEIVRDAVQSRST